MEETLKTTGVGLGGFCSLRLKESNDNILL